MDNIPLCEIPVYVTSRNGKPCIELRGATIEKELIKKLVFATFHKRPIIIKPVTRNDTKFMASVVSYGICYFDKEEQQYYFI